MRRLALCGLCLLSQGVASAEPALGDEGFAANVGIHCGRASHPNGDTGSFAASQTDFTLGLTIALGGYVRPTMAVMLNLRGALHPPLSSTFYASGFVGPGLRLAVTEGLNVQPALGLAGATEQGDYGSSAAGPAALVRAEVRKGAFAFGLEAMALIGVTHGYGGNGVRMWTEIALTAGFTR